MTSTSSTVLDFDDAQFDAAPKTYLPWCQMINPRYSKTGLLPHGLAVTVKNAAAVSFSLDAEGWQMLDYSFSTGVEQLLITSTPRLVIVRRSQTGIKDRATGAVVNVTWDEYRGDRSKYKTFNRYLVFLLDNNNQPLHEHPLQMTLSGSSNASFGMNYAAMEKGNLIGGFVYDLERAYAGYRKQPHSPKGDLFKAHGVYCPTLEVEEKGTPPNAALVCYTTGYVQPTAANLGNLMIPARSEFSQQIVSVYEEHATFGQPKEQPKAEPVATEPDIEDFEYGEPPY